jgi:hypothetical protein
MTRGLPDWNAPRVPTLKETGTGQSMFWWSEGVTVSANSYNTGTIYTVPTGKKLIITGLDVSCQRSFITLFQMLIASANVHQFWYDMRAFMPITDGAIELAAGELLRRVVYNYDTVNSNNFKVNILGYLVDA